MKYTKRQIAFHWATVALLIVMASTGMAYSFDLADDWAFAVHQIVGQALVLLLAARLFAKLRNPASSNSAHAAWERGLSKFVHIGLYAVMIGFAVTGYVSASAETDALLIAPVDIGFARSDTGEVFLDAHFALKWVLLGLISLHIAGALKHVLIDRDDTLSQMTFSNAKE